MVAAGSASGQDPVIDYPDQSPTVWVGGSDGAWRRVDLGIDGRLRGISATQGGAAVFGVTDVHGSPTSDAFVATSADGSTWEIVDGPFGPLAEPDGIQAMNGAVAIADDRLLFVGSDEIESETRGAAAVWWWDASGWWRQPHDRTVFGRIDESPTFTMTGGAWLEELVVVGFSGRSIDLPGGIGTACCIYEPAVWVWQPGG